MVLDQHESISDSNTNQRYRAFTREVERAVGQPVRHQYYKRGFTAIKQAKEGALDLVFGPAQVIANISKFKFEPILKSNETVAASFVAGPDYELLPLKLYSMVRRGVTPEINALSTVLFTLTLVVAGLAQRLLQRR